MAPDRPQPALEGPGKDPLFLVVLVLCLAIFVARAAVSLRQESATFDETHYLGLGQYLLQNGRWDVPGSILHPPLSYYLHSVPMLLDRADPSIWKVDPAQASDPAYRAQADLDRGRAILSSPANADDRLLTRARMAMVLTGALLCGCVSVWGYRLYGRFAGILAALLSTCCPNVLANTRLITPDIVVTAFTCLTVYFLWRLLDAGRMRYAVVGGVCLGLTLLSKFTAALAVPICLALMGLWWWKRRRIDLRGCALFLALGPAVLGLGYRMNLEPYFAGIAFQWAHAAGGHAGYLLGQHSGTGWWYYFLAAFALKSPVALLVLLAAAAVRSAGRARTAAWLDEAFLVLPAAVVFGFFSLGHQSIGLRYVLPAFPFLFVWTSQTAALLTSKRIVARAIAGAMVVWYVAASASIHPHYLAYFNEVAGGPDRGYESLVDSNLDWGQDLKGLARYMRERRIPKISLSYFGSDSPERYGIAYSWLPSYGLENPHPDGPEEPPGEWVAVSATNLQGVYFENKDLFALFRTHTPVAKIGYSIFVYHRPAGRSR